jgi:peptide-methionine (R)-S-oxide reductase
MTWIMKRRIFGFYELAGEVSEVSGRDRAIMEGVSVFWLCMCATGGLSASVSMKLLLEGIPKMAEKVQKTEEEWREQLGPEEYHVTREKGTEPAFSGRYHDAKEKGTYRCVCCGADLFHSDTKFDSGTGWPSFYEPMEAEAVIEEEDVSYGMRRVEALCSRCDAHLGHVFPDGPQPTGLRYCINSASLMLDENE